MVIVVCLWIMTVDKPWNIGGASGAGEEGGIRMLPGGTRARFQGLESGPIVEWVVGEEEWWKSWGCGLGGGFPPLWSQF